MMAAIVLRPRTKGAAARTTTRWRSTLTKTRVMSEVGAKTNTIPWMCIMEAMTLGTSSCRWRRKAMGLYVSFSKEEEISGRST
jgi:hypothetical protein